ncbi:MAG: endonuclease/exonuclease/phosphatase family protein [Deltaproteobacteria bacterium]|nr:endonuclease/exonuclease/phosphatase family protein [Deltaproteobacteria bacterium]
MDEHGETGIREPEGLLLAASYNVHRCVGMDGRQDPVRVAGVLRELGADIVGLQEVDPRPNPSGKPRQLERIAAAAGFHYIAETAPLRHDGRLANALLTGRRAREIRRIDLSHPGREPRGAIDVDIEIDGAIVRVIVTHLGLRPVERRFQVKRLLDVLSLEGTHLTVVMGDINEWLPGSRPLRWLHGRLGRAPAQRTFPSFLPLFALDRIWVWPRKALQAVEAHATSAARIASDHLPIKATIDVTTPLTVERRRIAPPPELLEEPETTKIGV